VNSSEESAQRRLERALAHPVRARVLARLEAEIASPKQLAHELGTSLGIVAYHVRVLVSLNLIRLVDVTPRRGSLEHRYTAVANGQLAPAPRAQADRNQRPAIGTRSRQRRP
jgi:DNA-binding transcriptional ArsR family regulator